MKIVLFEPEIPSNTGNIIRTCAVTGAGLILVKPLGFSLADRHLKRAGLDYFEGVEVEVIEDLVKYLEETTCPFYFFSSHASERYDKIPYEKEALLIFGSETKGLNPIFLQLYPERFVTVPMKKGARCLNLANTAAVVLYEACRQQDFSF